MTLRATPREKCERTAEWNRTRTRTTPVFLSGTAHPLLAQSIAREAATPLGACAIERFPDGEQRVTLLESVRQRQVILVQPLSPPSVNDHLMELLPVAVRRPPPFSPSYRTSGTPEAINGTGIEKRSARESWRIFLKPSASSTS